MSIAASADFPTGLLRTFLSEERFWPTEPRTLADSGLADSLIESLICKFLAVRGTSSGRKIAEHVCLPFRLLEDMFATLRTKQVLVHSGSAPFNDYYYALTERGRKIADDFRRACAYMGPAPVQLSEYINSVEAQAMLADSEAPTSEDLAEACDDISIDEKLFDFLGPAVNSGAGIFLYGSPGNGKSTLAQRITRCFGTHMWIPHAVIEDGQIIKVFDTAFHKQLDDESSGIVKTQDYDCRWVRIVRPTVVVGGELTLDSLEIRHDQVRNVSEAPLQMKSNGGCLLIDDFGRQRATPADLLNRWIVPLEHQHDFLTLPTGKKIQVPFRQLIIFSTNLEPHELVDEAFLRRIPYKIEVEDPGEVEFFRLFEIHAEKLGIEYRKEVVEYLIATHYRSANRRMRRCHPRDLLLQIRNYCRYRRMPLEMRNEYIDRVVQSYFAMVLPTTEAAGANSTS